MGRLGVTVKIMRIFDMMFINNQLEIVGHNPLVLKKLNVSEK